MLKNTNKIDVNKQIEEVKKPYVQFSKKMVGFLLGNMLVIELFVMFMIYTTKDTSSMPYLITGIAATALGGGIWYMKNSEAEKKARISAEVERMKFLKVIPEAFDDVLSESNENVVPDTYYKGSEGDVNDISQPDLIVAPNYENNTQEYTNNDEYFDDGSVG